MNSSLRFQARIVITTDADGIVGGIVAVAAVLLAVVLAVGIVAVVDGCCCWCCPCHYVGVYCTEELRGRSLCAQ